MGEEVAILTNLAVNVLTFFSNDKNFLFLVVFIYNKRKGNALSADSVRALVNVPVERITTFHEAPLPLGRW